VDAKQQESATKLSPRELKKQKIKKIRKGRELRREVEEGIGEERLLLWRLNQHPFLF